MAGTGLVFVGFVLLHMYGNLKLLSGEVAYNTYAEHLRTFGEPILPYGGLLWILRVVLIVCLVGHLYAAFSLWARAGNARRTRYSAARTAMRTAWMRWGGVAILLFLIWHLLEFTILKVSVNPDVQGPDVDQQPLPARRGELPGAVDDAHLRARDGRPRLHLAHGIVQRPADPWLDGHPRRLPPRQGHRLRPGRRHRGGVHHPAARDLLRPDQVRH